MAKRDQLKPKWEFAWISLSEEILAQICDVLPRTGCNDNEERFELKHCIDIISVEDEFLLLCTTSLHYFWASWVVYVLMYRIALYYNPQLSYPACGGGFAKRQKSESTFWRWTRQNLHRASLFVPFFFSFLLPFLNIGTCAWYRCLEYSIKVVMTEVVPEA